jgi:hypothetical protein
MGDIADDHVNQMIEHGMWGYPRRRSVYGPPLKCRYCGSTKVYWQAVKGQHEMYDKETLTRHECQVKDTEGFDDVV